MRVTSGLPTILTELKKCGNTKAFGFHSQCFRHIATHLPLQVTLLNRNLDSQDTSGWILIQDANQNAD